MDDIPNDPESNHDIPIAMVKLMMHSDLLQPFSPIRAMGYELTIGRDDPQPDDAISSTVSLKRLDSNSHPTCDLAKFAAYVCDEFLV